MNEAWSMCVACIVLTMEVVVAHGGCLNTPFWEKKKEKKKQNWGKVIVKWCFTLDKVTNLGGNKNKM